MADVYDQYTCNVIRRVGHNMNLTCICSESSLEMVKAKYTNKRSIRKIALAEQAVNMTAHMFNLYDNCEDRLYLNCLYIGQVLINCGAWLSLVRLAAKDTQHIKYEFDP